MKKLMLITFGFLFALVGFGQIVEADDFVDLTFNVLSYFDDYNETSNQLTDAYRTKVSFDEGLGSLSGYTFKYWIVDNVIKYQDDINTEFYLTEGISVKAMFSPSDKHLVLFMDSNGEYLGHDYVIDGQAADDTGVIVPDKPGYTVSAAKWDEDITAVTSDLVCCLEYELADVNTYTLSITDDISTYDRVCAFNETVTIEVSELLVPGVGMFQYWQDGDGNVISYFPALFVTVLSDQTYIAVYEDSPQVFTDFLWSELLELRDGYHTYHMRFEVNEVFNNNENIIEYGMLTSVENPIILTLETADDVIMGSRFTDTNEFLISIPKNHYYARPYIIYENDSAEAITVYGETYTFDGTKVAYEMDLEGDESKGGYASASVEINGQSWTLSDVLIGGSLSNDKVYGDGNLRMQDSGFIESDTPFEAGVSSIRLHLAKYGSDGDQTLVIKYAYEWAPDVWYTIQQDDSDLEIDVDSAELTPIEIDIDINASIYLRIEKTSSDGDKTCLDNILVNTYEYSNVAPTISDHSDDTMTVGDTYDATDGVTAIDFYDGDISDNITVEVKDSGNAVVAHGDFSGLAIGDYTVTLTIQDSRALTATDTYTLSIEEGSGFVSTGDELYISEYIEGSGSNKVLEIYNPTSQSIDLGSYSVKLYANGASNALNTHTFSSGTMLEPGQTVVLYNNSADSEFKTAGDLNYSSTACNFNGDDAIELVKNGNVIDSIGQVGVDPGSSWSNNGVSTVNSTLVRDPNVNSGDSDSSDGFDPSAEWISYPSDTSTYLGEHEANVVE